MPAISTYAGLLPLIVADLSNCPENLVIQALREAARQFCLDTEAWIVTQASQNIIADQQNYTIVPTEAADIRRIVEVRINTEDGVANGREGELQRPDDYHFDQPQTLVLHKYIVPRVSIAGALDVKVALAPYIISPETELDWSGFFAVWAMALCNHARMSLLLKPTRVWSNKELGVYFKALYDRDVGRAKAEIERRYTGMTPSVEA